MAEGDTNERRQSGVDRHTEQGEDNPVDALEQVVDLHEGENEDEYQDNEGPCETSELVTDEASLQTQYKEDSASQPDEGLHLLVILE